MQHCLSKEEIDTLVNNNWNVDDDNEFRDLNLLLSQCKIWENEMVLFPYFLSQVLERRSKMGNDCSSIIQQVFEMPSTMLLSIQGFDAKFIKYIFYYLRDRNLTLQEELIDVQSKFGQHVYE